MHLTLPTKVMTRADVDELLAPIYQAQPATCVLDWASTVFVSRSAAHQVITQLEKAGIEVEHLNRNADVLHMMEIVDHTRFASSPIVQRIPLYPHIVETVEDFEAMLVAV